MMSRCFTWFPNWLVLGEPNIYHDSGVFYKNVGSFWKVTDCEEIDMCIVVSGTCPTCSVLKVWK